MNDNLDKTIDKMQRTRLSRRILMRGTLAAGVGALLAACGADDEPDPTSEATIPTPEPVPATPADAAQSDSSTQETADTREFEHAFGTTEIPVAPERIVTLDYFALEAMLALGVKPVGASLNGTVDSQHDYIRDQLAGITPVAISLGEPDIEAIVALEPDLILGLDIIFEERRDTFENVAPIAAFAFESSGQWKETFRFYADAAGRANDADAVMGTYEARAAELEDMLSEHGLNQLEASVVRVYEDSLGIYNRPSFIGTVLEDVGIARPETQLVDDFSTEVSFEQIRTVDADILFIWGRDNNKESENQHLEELESDQLFAQLEAVQNGRAYFVDGETWIGSSILAANAVIDDLFEIYQSLTDSTGTVTQYPVTIEHKYGSTEITQAPERVATIGFSEQDAVLALGVTPVAIREWFGQQPHAVWPWAQDELGDAEPEVLNLTYGELDYELIIGLQADVLLATHSGITADEYETLAQIAPTVAQTGDVPDFGMAWQDQTRLIGMALGRESLAEERITEVEDLIAAAADEHPEFSGATIAWISPTGDGQYWAVGPNTPPLRFLAALGFQLPEELAAVVGDLDSATISSEQMRLLDADVLIIQAGSEDMRSTIEDDPVYQQLNAAAEGRTIFFSSTEDPTYAALSFSTVLSLPFAVEHLVPMLAAAVDGDPDTTASS